MKVAAIEKDQNENSSVENLSALSLGCLQKKDFAGVLRYCTQILEQDQENVTALNQIGIAYAMTGRIPDAIDTLEKALAINPEASEIKENLLKLKSLSEGGTSGSVPPDEAVKSLAERAEKARGDPKLSLEVMLEASNLAKRLAEAGRRECIEAMRVSLGLQTTTLFGQVNLHNYLLRFGEKAKLEDFARNLAPEQLGRHLLVACFPKSGSTLLNRLLREVTGFAEAQYCFAFLQNEQEFYLPLVLASATDNRVIQQHCRATVPNLHIMQAFNIKPVVLVRNIFDVLLSWKEFLEGGAHINTFFPYYADLSDEERMALVVDDRAPWYLSFFASWQYAQKAGQIDCIWQTYEQVTAAPEAALESILEFYGIKADPIRLARATQMVNKDTGTTRFNKGKVGRGRNAFTEEQVAQIRRLASYYKGVDFSLIGLEP